MKRTNMSEVGLGGVWSWVTAALLYGAIGGLSNAQSLLPDQMYPGFIQTVNADVFPIPPAIADFDGDGDVDAVVAGVHSNSYKLVLLSNLGDGTFDTVPIGNCRIISTSIEASDIDNDGDQDVIVFCQGTSSLCIFRNNGSGMFAKECQQGVSGNTITFFVGDIDGDSYADLILPSEVIDTLRIFLNDGFGTFSFSTSQLIEIPASTTSVQLADVDYDSDLDLVLGMPAPEGVSILHNDGAGSFTQGATHELGTHLYLIETGDLNNDSYDDLICFGYIVLNAGDGTFLQPVAYPAISGAQAVDSVVIADVDDDGLQDIVVAHQGGYAFVYETTLLHNAGSGIFSVEPFVYTGQHPAVVAADFVGDGRDDVLLIEREGLRFIRG